MDFTQPRYIWWGERSYLAGRAGYACFTPADTTVMREWELKKAGEGLNPATDPHFVALQTFGEGPYRVQLYRFDLR